MLEPSLDEALLAISEERPQVASRAVRRLLQTWGEHGLAERLYGSIEACVDRRLIPALLELFYWSANDGDLALLRTFEAWLEAGTDPGRIEFALSLNHTYPFVDPARMETVLSALAQRYPHLAPRCSELIDSRRKLKDLKPPSEKSWLSRLFEG